VLFLSIITNHQEAQFMKNGLFGRNTPGGNDGHQSAEEALGGVAGMAILS